MSDLKLSYEVLSAIYKDGAYSSIELSKALEFARSPQFVTKLVYGVLERNTELDYYLANLVAKKPANSIIILLKIGLYCLQYMDSMPQYAVVDNTVQLCDEVKKRELKGFVNGVLKAFCGQKPELPTDIAERLSVTSSTPLWLVKQYIKQYGIERADKFLMAQNYTREHIRNNSRRMDMPTLIKALDEKNVPYNTSSCGGLFVENARCLRDLYDKGMITYQSLTSMTSCQMVGVKDGDKVLDLCAAPGGKSIYLSELAQNVEIVACDIHEHRLELINKYIYRMRATGITVEYNDATVFNAKYEKAFDVVLCDAPCSGFGVAGKKPDIYLSASLDKVMQLAELQYKIISEASKYVKDNGTLIYSTCTMLRQENFNVIGRFVKENEGWKIESHKQFLPDDMGTDGFFEAKLVKAC